MKAFVAVAALAAFAAVASADLGLGLHHGGHHGVAHGHHGHHIDHYAYPAYKYSYGVADKHTGDIKSAHEVRDGHITKGSYSLVQPDGVLRTVNYVVDPKGGFQAQVINKGWAAHPAIKHHGHHHGHGHIGGLGLGAGIVG